MTARRSTAGLRRLRGPLLRWYRRNRRALPWRNTLDPYAIWVAEIMLQQTQVATVLPYYRRFLERFPDVHALADAGEEAVLSAWSGLGYYRRARSLHAAACRIVRRHGGRVPDDPVALRALPGVGRYTAGAIASVAYGREEPVLDGNVRRVLSRLLAVAGDDEPALWNAAQEMVRGRSPGDLNQALMELGAVVCTPRGPACRRCPARSGCRAAALGRAERFPRPRARRKTETVRVAVAVVTRDGRLLLERPGGASPLRGSWDLPAVAIVPEADARPVLAREIARRHGLTIRVGDVVGRVAHAILHRRLRLEAYHCRLLRGRPSEREELRWVRHDGLTHVPISGATRKLLRATR